MYQRRLENCLRSEYQQLGDECAVGFFRATEGHMHTSGKLAVRCDARPNAANKELRSAAVNAARRASPRGIFSTPFFSDFEDSLAL